MLTAGQERRTPLRWRLSAHARRLATLAVAGLLIAVITRRAEFAGLAAPALLLLAPFRAQRPSDIGLTLASGTDQVVEGSQGTVAVRVGGLEAERQSDVSVRPRLLPAAWITPGLQGHGVGPGQDGWYRLPFLVEHWGTRPVGLLELTVRDRWWLAEARLLVDAGTVTCYPESARLESLIVLSKLQARLGEHTARIAGEGFEFAGVRAFVPGDRQRRINWPATTRLGALQLNTFAAERAQAVVVIADFSTNLGPPGHSSDDFAVRGAVGTAAAYLAARDRVGLICFGRRLRWLAPAAGQRQAHRIMDLIVADPGVGEQTDVVTRLPRAALPPGALIIVFSPLLSLRVVEALRELRERGFATVVVDVLTAEPPMGRRRDRKMIDLARRVWRMEQQAIRFSLRELGIPVVHWDGLSPLDEPLAPFTRRAMVT